MEISTTESKKHLLALAMERAAAAVDRADAAYRRAESAIERRETATTRYNLSVALKRCEAANAAHEAAIHRLWAYEDATESAQG